MADGRLGEAFIEFSFGGNILARCSSGAPGGSHHADGMEGLHGYEFRLGPAGPVFRLPQAGADQLVGDYSSASRAMRPISFVLTVTGVPPRRRSLP